jgi:O-antigen/teichoic acid export membrane protein
MSVSNALKWSFLSELAAKIVQPVVFVVLARLLTPEDFGVVAAAMMVISFSQIFWEAGMGKAVIQSQEDRNAVANTAFWINNFLGLFVAGVLISVSNPIAEHIFHDQRVGLVLQVMSIQVFLAALSAVHTALLQKDMHFKRLFWVRFATVSLPGLVSIPLALKGMGYWAIVFGTLAGQAIQVIVLWNMSTWRPSTRIDRDVGEKLVRFGSWVAFSGLLAWFYGWADSLIVGMYLGAKELGLYRTGSQLVVMIYAIIFSPVLPVLYSHLSKIQSNQQRANQGLVKVISIITFISIPLAFILYLSGGDISIFVLGSKWDGVGEIVSILALSVGFSWITYPNVEYYRGQGRPDLETKTMLYTITFYLPAYIYSSSLGLTQFLWTRLGLALLSVVVHWRFLLANSVIKLHYLIAPVVKYLPAPLLVVLTLTVINKFNNQMFPFYHAISISFGIALIVTFTAFIGGKSELSFLFKYMSRK